MAGKKKSDVPAKTSDNKELIQVRHLLTMERKRTKSIFAKARSEYPQLFSTKTRFRNAVRQERIRAGDIHGISITQRTALLSAGYPL